MSQDEIDLEEFSTLQILEKLSEKHISFNKRLIELNVHLLCYYSNIPPYFHKGKKIPENQYPKQGVQILDIINIDKDDESTRKLKRPNVFKIEFNKKCLIDFKKSGKEAGQLREKYIYNYIDKDKEKSSLINSINSSRQQDKNGKQDSNQNKTQWVFQCKSQKERDEWVHNLLTLQKLLKAELDQQEREDKFKNNDRNYSSIKSNSGNNSNYQHPQHSNYFSRQKSMGDYQSANSYNNQHSNFNNTGGGLFKIEEEDRNEKHLNSMGDKDLIISHENSREMNESLQNERKINSFGGNNRNQQNKQLSSSDMSNIQNSQQQAGNLAQSEKMIQEQEKSQNDFQKKRQENRQQSMNQQYDQFITIQPENSHYQNQQNSDEDEDEDDRPLKQQQKKEEERKRAEEEKNRKEKEEIERAKKQKEDEDIRQRNKKAYESQYELQYQDFNINSVNVQNSSSEQMQNILCSSSQLNFDREPQLDSIKIFSSPFNQFSPQKKDKIDEKFKNNFKLLNLIGTFNQAAQKATKLLIEDLIFSGNLRKYFPNQIKKEYINFDQMNMNDIHFEMQPSYEFLVEVESYNNFVIKLSWITQESITLQQNVQNDQKQQNDQQQVNYSNASMGQIIEHFINSDSPQITTSKYRFNSKNGPNTISPSINVKSTKQREQALLNVPDYAPTINVYTNYHGKSLSSEFKALNQINTWHINRRSDTHRQFIKVPLSCIVTYRGFKALVQANPPDAEGLVHGPQFNQDKYYEGYKTHPQVEPLLKQLGEYLGIRPHYFRYGNNPKCKVYLSFVTEIHNDQRIQRMRQQFINQPHSLDSPKLKIETYYLKNVGDIFPVNDNPYSENSKYKNIQFRHEYLKKFDRLLNPDAFEDQDEDQDNQEDVEQLVQASVCLENVYLKKFVSDLDELQYNVIDCLTLNEVLHKQGINMKYLGHIASNTTIPFIMNICIVDMVARAFKKIIHNCISDFYLNSSKWVTPDEQNKKNTQQQGTLIKMNTFGKAGSSNMISQQNITQQPSSTSLNQIYQNNLKTREQRIRQLDELVRDAIIDILNMLYGDDEETERFHEILNQQVQYDFNYEQLIDIKAIHKGSLLDSICYHCDLNMVYSSDIFIQNEKYINELQKLNQKEYGRNQDEKDQVEKKIQLFQKDNYIDHHVSSSVFTMDSLNVVQYINIHEEKFINPESYEQQINSIKQHLKVLDCTNSLSFFKRVYLHSILSKLYFQKKDILNATNEASQVVFYCTQKIEEEQVLVPNIHLVKSMIILIQISLMKDIPEDIKKKTVVASKNVMKLQKFLVDENHPIFYELTRVFINDKIQKKDVPFESMKQVLENDLNGLIRALGPNHLHTANRYQDVGLYLFQNDKTCSGAQLYFEKAYSDKSQKNILDSKAICAFYLCRIYYQQNKIEQCWSFLKITQNLFKDNKDYLDKLCKLYLIKCDLVKRTNIVKQIVDECENTWKFFENCPFGKVKLLDCYKDLIKIYIETIVSTWDRNNKIQFHQMTDLFKELLEKKSKEKENDKRQAHQKETNFSTQLNQVQVSDSLRQSIDLTSPSNQLKQNSNLASFILIQIENNEQYAFKRKHPISPLYQPKQTFQQSLQVHTGSKQQQYLGNSQNLFSGNQFKVDREKQTGIIQHLSYQSLDENYEVSVAITQEEKIHNIITMINKSNVEIWRFVEKQFLTLSNMKFSKIQKVFNEKGNQFNLFYNDNKYLTSKLHKNPFIAISQRHNQVIYTFIIELIQKIYRRCIKKNQNHLDLSNLIKHNHIQNTKVSIFLNLFTQFLDIHFSKHSLLSVDIKYKVTIYQQAYQSYLTIIKNIKQIQMKQQRMCWIDKKERKRIQNKSIYCQLEI